MAKAWRTEGGSLDASWGEIRVIWSSLSKGVVGLNLHFRKKSPGCYVVEGGSRGRSRRAGWLGCSWAAWIKAVGAGGAVGIGMYLEGRVGQAG